MCRKSFSIVLAGLIILCLLISCNKHQKSEIHTDEIDTSRDPIQKRLESMEPVFLETKHGRYTLTPVAEYQLAGVVVGKETYSYDWNSEISPVDLAIAWGKLAEPEFEKYVSFSQRNRWYFFEYRSDSPLDHSYIISHSSNNHIIPATRDIYQALKTINRKEKVMLEGFLVNVKGTHKGRPVYWNTSLTRHDTGDGSCELIYVTRLKINSDVYE